MFSAALAAVAVALGVAWARGPAVLRPLISLRHPGAPWISTDGLATALRSDAPPLLLDARSPEEIAVSTIEGAQPLGALAAVPRDRAVVVYCSVGWRSAAVVERLRALGHRDVRNLEGGIFAWANEGRPLVREGRRARAVHPYDALWGLWLRGDAITRGAPATTGS